MQGIIELILATDMARHGEFMDKYKQCLASGFDVNNDDHLQTVRKNNKVSYVVLSRQFLNLKSFTFTFNVIAFVGSVVVQSVIYFHICRCVGNNLHIYRNWVWPGDDTVYTYKQHKFRILV